MMMTIYYDITDILAYARRHSTLGGIQRVSIELLYLLATKNGNERLKVIAFHPTTQRVVSFDVNYFTRPFEYDQQDFCEAFGLGAEMPSDLQQYVDRKYKNKFQVLIKLVTDDEEERPSSSKSQISAAVPPPKPKYIPVNNTQFDAYSQTQYSMNSASSSKRRKA